MYNMKPVTDEEQAALEDMCQENGWLKRGGYDWQDDPFMEEYPYEFDRCFSMDDLSDFFKAGNWAIRQGVVYGDLAFIQQVNGGDEWWTLKQDDDGAWIPFESMSFGAIAKDRSDLVRYIAGMRLATPEECKRLDYLPDKTSLTWTGDAFPCLDDGEVRAIEGDYMVCVTANRIGKMLTVSGPEEAIVSPEEYDEGVTLLQVVNEQVKAFDAHLRGDQLRPLGERAHEAIKAAENQQRASKGEDPRAQSR